MFGIKNARRSAGQDKFVVRGGVNKQIAGGTPVGLGDYDLLLGNDLVEFSRSRKRLAGTTTGFEKCVHFLGGDGDVGAFGDDIAVEVRSALVVCVGEARGGNGNRSRWFRRGF